MRIFYLLVACLVLFSCHNLQKNEQFEFQEGDLIFQDLNSDSISDAIESVTGGKEKLNFSHVGIVDLNEEGDVFVLEAISKGVSYTPLHDFMARSKKIAVGRLKANFSNRIAPAMKYGKSLLGLPYDDVYVMGDSSYYCSELIYEMFAENGDSSTIFKLNPMTFKDSETGKFMPFWKDYYKNLKVDIPEGKPGLNPNGMYQSKNIDIVYKQFLESTNRKNESNQN